MAKRCAFIFIVSYVVVYIYIYIFIISTYVCMCVYIYAHCLLLRSLFESLYTCLCSPCFVMYASVHVICLKVSVSIRKPKIYVYMYVDMYFHLLITAVESLPRMGSRQLRVGKPSVGGVTFGGSSDASFAESLDKSS